MTSHMTRTKTILIAGLLLLLPSLSGCCRLRRSALQEELAASQLRSQELFAEQTELEGLYADLQNTNSMMHQSIASLDGEKQLLAQQLGQTENQLATANTRIDNLLAERNELKDRYAALLQDTSGDPMLSGMKTAAVPGFQRDELTGLNKFPEDVLFDLGSAELRPEAMPVLQDFADVVNSPESNGMRILIVGHTDDQPIARPGTAVKHPTNWHLSTDRSDQVVLQLEKLGVSSERMAAMGYSRFQPLETGTDERSRQRNRRVELYLVPNSTQTAAWDPVRSLN
ncbi:MAG: OmpA family protein [Planctomycetaceae bacterium]